MTDFEYNMDNKILSMEQKGKQSAGTDIARQASPSLNFNNLDKPTFFATNSMSDTIAFTFIKS